MEEETCMAPDGKPMLTFGLSSKTLSIVAVSFFGFLPLAGILVMMLGPKLVFWVGGWVGTYLRTKTEGRKVQILELVENDEEAWVRDAKKEGGRRDSDEWESVEGYAGASVGNGEKGGEEFDGIVGFFHPFW